MARPRSLGLVLVLGVLHGPGRAARADDVIPGHAIDRGATGLVIGGALVAAAGVSLLPDRADRSLWSRELFGALDDDVHGMFSPTAARIADGLVAASIVAPIGYLVGGEIEDADGDRLLIYGESLAINLALFQAAKRLVQRPRPYLYHPSPEVARYARGEGSDAFQSFYSAHAATSFCAATTGAYLAAASSGNKTARAFIWGSGFAVAAATANLRVRAGKHFYSDVVIGGLAGIAIGYAVPALHADAGANAPSLADVGAALAGVLGGVAVSELLPVGEVGDARAPRGGGAIARARLQLAPLPIVGGAGLAIGGAL